MPSTADTIDAFITHSPQDRASGSLVADACRGAGLAVATHFELALLENEGERIREAIAECRAMVVILSRLGLSANVGIEIGAAQAWSKPIFGVVDGHTTSPGVWNVFRKIYTIGRIGDLVREVEKTLRPLSDDELETLKEIYLTQDKTVDQLLRSPGSMTAFVVRFSDVVGRELPGEVLLSELLRLRKGGHLPVRRSPPRPKPRTKTA